MSDSSSSKSSKSDNVNKEKVDISKLISHDFDTFLDFNLYKKIKNEIIRYLHFMKDTKDVSKVLKKLSQKFKYIRTFNHQGVQGLTGVLAATAQQYKDLPVVFKLSVEIDKVVEHEFSILEDLSSIREFCPHFVSSFNMVQLPISRTYIYTHTLDEHEKELAYNLSLSSDKSDSDESSDSDSYSDDSSEEDDSEFEDLTIDDVELFMNDGEYLPTNVLFMEYVSNISFSDICRIKIRQNKDIILSQMLMILSALTTAQKHCKLTHYDLHIDNILVRECETNALFAYNFDDNVRNSVIIPTFGFYPVIIDMGSSYSKAVDNNQMTTSVANYEHGLQPVLFDKINDLHHFLLSALYDLEYATEEFYYLSTHMIYFFRHLPVLRKKGWKQLPNSMIKSAVKQITLSCQDVSISYSSDDVKEKSFGLKTYPVWSDMDRDLVEILSYGIRVPWTDQFDEELDTLISKTIQDENERIEEAIRLSFIPFLKEFQKFDNMSCFEDPNDLLFLLKELVDIIYSNWDAINKQTSKQTTKLLFSKFKYALNKEFRDMPASLNFSSLILSTKYCISTLNKFYYKAIKPNKELIAEKYEKTDIESPLDMLKWFRQNSSLRLTYTKDTIIYVWDTVLKTRNKVVLGNIFKEELDKDPEYLEKLNKDKPIKAQHTVLSKLFYRNNEAFYL
jgi:hypothetical protein